MAEIPAPDNNIENPLAKRARDFYNNSKGQSDNWRKEFEKAYNFFTGHQWEDNVVFDRRANQRPSLVFNIIQAVIDSVSGTEINNRQDIKYVSRRFSNEPEDDRQPIDPSQVKDQEKSEEKDPDDPIVFAETLTCALQYFRDKCFAEEEESAAFVDMIIGGLGFTETYIDMTDNPKGDLRTLRIDPTKVYYDVNAKQKNLADSNGFILEAAFTEKQLRNRWGSKANDIIAAAQVYDPASMPSPVDREAARYYKGGGTPNYYKRDGEFTRYVVWQYEFIDYENAYLVKPQGADEPKEVGQAEYDELKKQYPVEIDIGLIETLPFKKKVHKKTFLCGDYILDEPKVTDGFSLRPITGKYDRKKNSFYGILRGLFDPQELLNKMMSQAVHVVDVSAKGGVMVERGAITKFEDFKNSFNKAESITMVEDGAISGNKIAPKFGNTMPDGAAQLIQLVMQLAPMVTGVNLEMLGAADRDQAGVLEYQRKVSALAILAPFFDSLRRYKVDLGKYCLKLIINDLSDGRYIRIVGKKGEKFIPLNSPENVDAAEYDVLVEQSMTSPNQKQETWISIQQLIPIAQAAGYAPPADFIKYAPLPQDLADAWYKQASGNSDPQAMAQRLQGLQQQLADAQSQNQQMNDAMNQLMDQNKALTLDVENRKRDLDIKQQNANVGAFKAETEAQKVSSEIADKSIQTFKDIIS